MKRIVFIICVLCLGVSAPANAETETGREELIKSYFSQFVSTDIRSYPAISKAIYGTLEKLPDDVFDFVTNRKHPVVFIPTLSNGIARFARSTQFRVEEAEPPAFGEGFYLITLSDELNEKDNETGIAGVIAHEIAHYYLGHLQQDSRDPCDLEREANNTIRDWGFTEEFGQAKDLFGAKHKGDSPCHDREDVFEQ